MASNIKGITVEIGGNTAPLDKALKDVNKTSRDLQSELKAVNNALKLDPSNTTLIIQKQQLLGSAVENTKKKLDSLKAAQSQVEFQFVKGDISESQYRAFQREIINTESKLNDLQSKLNETNNALKNHSSVISKIGKDYKESFDEAQKSMGNTFEQTKKAGQVITGVGVGIAAGLGVAAKGAADFEQSMANVYSVMAPDEVSKFSGELKSLAITMGAETKYSATEAAQGIEELVKAGVSVSDIMNGGLKGALSLATAGELDLASAAEIASTALNAFKNDGLSVQHAADILAGAANASATSVSELKFGLSAVSAVASSVGWSFKDTTTALAEFAQNGLKGSDAGTSLKTMLMNLQPSTDKAAGAMQALGIITKDGSNKFIDAKGHFKNLAEISDVLQNSMKGLTDAQRLSYMETIFGSDAIRAANILFKEGSKGANEMATAMGKISSDDVAAQKMNTFNGTVEQLSGSLETAEVSIGNALLPALKILANTIQSLIDKFNALSPGMQSTIAISAAIAAVLALIIGPLLILVESLPLAAAGFSMLAGPIGTAITSIAGLGTTALTTFSSFPALGTKLAALGAQISRFVFGPWNLLGNAFKSLPGLIRSFSFADIITKIITPFKNIPVLISSVFSKIPGILNGVKIFFTTFGSTIIGLGPRILTAIRSAFSIQGIMTAARTALTIFTGPWGALILGIAAGIGAIIANWGAISNYAHQIFGGNLTQTFSQFTQFLSQVWNSISNAVTAAWNYISPTIIGAVNQVSSFWNEVWPQIKQVFVEVWNVMQVLIAPAVTALYVAISGGLGFIKGAWSDAWNVIKDTLKIVWDGITGIIKIAWDLISGVIRVGLDLLTGNWSKAWTDMKSIFSNLWTDIKSLFKNMASDALTWGKDMIQGIIDGIMGAVGGVEDAVRNVADKIRRFLHFTVPDEGPLSDADTYGTDFMELLANTIEQSGDKPADAAKDVADKVSQVIKSKQAQLKDEIDKLRADEQSQVDALQKQLRDTRDEGSDAIRGTKGSTRYGIEDAYRAEKEALQDKIKAVREACDAEVKARKDAVQKEIDLLKQGGKAAADELKKEVAARKEYVSKINDLESKLKDSIKQRYQEEQELEEKRIKLETDNKTKELQNRINALDEQSRQHDIEIQDAEDTEKEKQLRQILAMNYSKKKKEEAQKELDDLLKTKEERKYKESIDSQKQALQNQIDQVKENNDKMLENVKSFYEAKLSEANLNAEAEKMIVDNNQKDIVNLLHRYGKDYEMAGQTLGERLMEGFKVPLDNLKGMLESLSESISSVQNANLVPAIATPAASFGSAITNNNSSSSTVNNYGSLLHAENISINGYQDTRAFAEELEFYRNQVDKSRGR